VEDQIYRLDSYRKICLTQSDGSCHHPFGFPSLIYAKAKDAGKQTYTLATECALASLLAMGPGGWSAVQRW
jgi:hypothetical protein